MIRLAALSLLFAAALSGSTATFRNPVIPGFAPDPSIVRVGGDFYLVNSSFEYFPGLPIYHSRDLVNWELVGHAVADAGSSGLAQAPSSGGLQAATIHHHAGLFYVVCTNIVGPEARSFVVTASDPRGPWSHPHHVAGAEGIDPSLFFDDDGRAWWTANRVPPDPAFPGQAEIWLQEFDLATLALKGPRHALSRGNSGGIWAEGPHLYKRGGWYYLLLAEGGTSYEHAVTIAVAKNITGPYRPSPRNPVLTHRHLSYDAPITGVGHADLVELADGRWYAVALGWRRLGGRHAILGRETFLVPVRWEPERETWRTEPFDHPVFSPASGKVEEHYPLPFADRPQAPRRGWRDDFSGEKLGPEWSFRRAPLREFWQLRPGHGLRLELQPAAIAEGANYSFVGVRQRDFRFTAETRVVLADAGPGTEAGIVVIQKDDAAVSLTLRSHPAAIELNRWAGGRRTLLGSLAWSGDRARLRVVGDGLDYRFSASPDGADWQAVGEVLDGRMFSPGELPGFNYTGVHVGLYGSAEGAEGGRADFTFFRYDPQPE